MICAIHANLRELLLLSVLRSDAGAYLCRSPDSIGVVDVWPVPGTASSVRACSISWSLKRRRYAFLRTNDDAGLIEAARVIIIMQQMITLCAKH